MTHPKNLVLAAALCTAPLLSQSLSPGQDPAGPLAAAPTSLPWPDRVSTGIAADGTLWAGAESWKASFTANGATFHPFLGSDAPDCAATFALRAVRCGGEELPLLPGLPELRELCVRYERGAVRELFDLGTAGLEHRFVFDGLPSRGALQLEVAVTSDLTVAGDATGHALLGPRGGVRYGRATAIDARGQRCALTTVLAGGALRIDVPAAFVADAVLPLVVDPLVGSINTVATSTKELLATDIAFDASLAQFFITYERAFSATDHDVYVVCADSSMAPVSTLTIDYTTENWTQPRIATLEAHDLACVVAQTSTGNVAPFAIKGRMVTGGPTPQTGAVMLLASAANHDYVQPDIGGDSDPIGSDHFLLAYEELSTSANATFLFYERLDANGVQSSGHLLGTGVGFTRRVAVSKTCGRPGGGTEGWALVHRRELYQQSAGNLRVSFVNRDGSLRDNVGPYEFVDITVTTPNAGSEWDVSSPTDDALGRNFLCVERRVDPANGRAAIYGTAFDWLGNIVTPSTNLLGNGVDRRLPRADCDGARFAFTNDNNYSPTDHDVRISTVALVGGQLLTEAYDLPSVANDLDTAPAVVAMRGFQPNSFGLAWVHSDGTAWSMQCERYLGLAAGGISSRNTACGPIGLIAVGIPQLGGNFSIVVTNVTGLPAIIGGTPTSVPVGPCPGCTLGVDGVILVGSQVLINVPFDPMLVGATVSFQGLQVDGALGGCLGQFQLGNTLDVTVQ
ncbi:MAG TPA: hypothetical protein VFZ65_00800 [Planctomycetota bacterium]|nr:hypothetical protein [Planctomycetota bacterium]